MRQMFVQYKAERVARTSENTNIFLRRYYPNRLKGFGIFPISAVGNMPSAPLIYGVGRARSRSFPTVWRYYTSFGGACQAQIRVFSSFGQKIYGELTNYTVGHVIVDTVELCPTRHTKVIFSERQKHEKGYFNHRCGSCRYFHCAGNAPSRKQRQDFDRGKGRGD